MNLVVHPFFDIDTCSYSYVLANPGSGTCAVIDPVLNYDLENGEVSTVQADQILEFVKTNGYIVEWILETHVHADHVSAAPYIKEQLGGQTAIGENVTRVQAVFGKLFNAEPGFDTDGRQFDRLFADGEVFRIGELDCEVIGTPGHTNDSVSYRIGSHVFVGDSMFMPDFGTARCDFPGGDAGLLYDSIERLLSLPEDTRLYMCHDYKPGGRELRWVCTVAEQRAGNIHVGGGVSKDAFSKMRTERDAGLGLPALIIPSIQVNIRAGHLPDEDDNGVAYLKVPIDIL